MRTRLVLCVAVLGAACGISPSGTGQQTAPYDLDNPDLVAQLGAAAPSRVDWERNIEGTTVVGVGSSADPAELELIGGAISEVPRPLASVVEPRTVIRTHRVDSFDPNHVGARAFALGPDIYLVDSTFDAGGEPLTRYDLARAYFHELAHVAQFRTLDAAYVEAALAGAVTRVDPTSGSILVRDFAAATGWIDGSGGLEAAWQLTPGSSASSAYGGVDPAEDMAEAVAMVALGRAAWIPADRARWVVEWLDSTVVKMSENKPWAPAGAQEVLSTAPVYDEAEVARLSSRFNHVEPMYFQLSSAAPSHNQLAAQVQAELSNRRVVGVLKRTDDERLPRYSGLFQRTDGVSFWVELWDFREASGFDSPDAPVLTYVVLW